MVFAGFFSGQNTAPATVPVPSDILTNASYTAGNYYTLPQSSSGAYMTNPFEISLRSNGTQLYGLNRSSGGGGTLSGRYVYTWNLSTPFDITTASWASKAFDLSPHGLSTPSGMAWNSTGTQFCVVDDSNGNIRLFTASTSWDVTTLSLTSSSTLPSAYTNAVDCEFINNDTEIAVLSTQGKIRKQSLPSLANISSSVLDLSTVSGFPSGQSWEGMFVNAAGDKLLVADSTGDYVVEMDLATPYDFQSVSTVNQSINLNSLISPTNDNRGQAKIYNNSLYLDRTNWYTTGLYVSSPNVNCHYRMYRITLN